MLSVVSRLNRLATQRVALPIPGAQARLLSTIEDLDVARISDLAAVDHCSQPTMTTQVRRLEDAGLTTRTPDPLDARAVLIRITNKGVETMARVRQDRAAALDPGWTGFLPKTARRLPTRSTCCTDSWPKPARPDRSANAGRWGSAPLKPRRSPIDLTTAIRLRSFQLERLFEYAQQRHRPEAILGLLRPPRLAHWAAGLRGRTSWRIDWRWSPQSPPN